MPDNSLIDPEIDTLATGSKLKIMRQEQARRSIVIGNGLFVHGTGYERDSPLGNVISIWRNWFHSPDPALLFASLGTIAGHMLPGPPVWLMLVGQASSGKTEVIMASSGVPREIVPTALVSSLKESSMLSGTPAKERTKKSTGGILPQLEPQGVLLLKDFTSVLQMDRDERGKCLAALREVYDGEWTRPVGTDGGRELHYKGKCSALGGVTPVIDNYHSVMVSMGERFMYFRLPLVNGYAQARVAMENAPWHSMIQESTRAAVSELFQSLVIPDTLPTLDGDDLYRMTALANIITVCRAPVERDPRTHEILSISPPEGPARVSKSLNQLFQGMQVIGVHRDESWRIISKVAMDSMSAVRLMIIQTLSMGEGANSFPSYTSEQVSTILKYPATPIRRALEDLETTQFIARNKTEKSHTWALTPFAKNEYRCAFPIYEDGR